MNKSQRIKTLKKKLEDLEKNELVEAQEKLSEAYKDGTSWEENPTFSTAKEELDLVQARIAELSETIRQLEEKNK